MRNYVIHLYITDLLNILNIKNYIKAIYKYKQYTIPVKLFDSVSLLHRFLGGGIFSIFSNTSCTLQESDSDKFTYIPPCGIFSKPTASGVRNSSTSSSVAENCIFNGGPPPVPLQ